MLVESLPKIRHDFVHPEMHTFTQFVWTRMTAGARMGRYSAETWRWASPDAGATMAMWLYQMDQRQWPPNSYRLDIWENERWTWPVGRKASAESPKPGDRVVFFYAPAGGIEPGFYGWAVVLNWHEDERGMYFRPVAPSDHLKMHPWWDDAAKEIADAVRGKVKQGTLWIIPHELAARLSAGITAWLSRARPSPSASTS